jgi:hypothetical protein
MRLAHITPLKFAVLSAFFKFESKFNHPNEWLNLQIFSIARKIWAREICALLGALWRTRLDLVAKISQA